PNAAGLHNRPHLGQVFGIIISRAQPALRLAYQFLKRIARLAEEIFVCIAKSALPVRFQNEKVVFDYSVE
ncbi:MAG TPA: hypothetical protein VIF39_13905, partial [Hyphomicrobium sp.]